MKFISYENYLNTKNAISFDIANQVYAAILSANPDNDNGLSILLEKMINQATDYAGIRSNWLLLSIQEAARMNLTRSLYHDLFIEAVNNVSDYMYKKGYGNQWRALLGKDRKRIGDFACYLSYIQSLNAR